MNQRERLQAIADKYDLGTAEIGEGEGLLEVFVPAGHENSADAIEEFMQEGACTQFHYGDGGVSSIVVLTYYIAEEV